jgi:pullulanase
LKAKNSSVVEYYKSVIQMRKDHPAFKMPNVDSISTHLEFMDLEPGVVGYNITGNANGDAWSKIVVLFNANKKPVDFYFNEEWTLALDIEKGYHENGKKVIGNIKLDPISAYVFYK